MAEVLQFALFPTEPPAIELAGPPDAEARRQALDISTSFIVEAPAGSGKTGLLIQRYLKLLADDSVTEPEQVLAVTFTNKATAELRDRVLAHLEAASGGPAPVSANSFDRQTRVLAIGVLERDQQRNWSLLDQPYRLNIRTIDSVCAEIARTLPVLSGSGGRLTPATDADPLHREAARRTLLLLGGGDATFDRSLRDLLLHRDGNLADCESLLANMLSLRDQWGELIPLPQRELDDAYLDATVLPHLERVLDHAICDTLSQLNRLFPKDALTELATIAAAFALSNGYQNEPSPVACCADRHDPPEPVAAGLEHWRALIHLLLTKESWRSERGITRKNLSFDYDRRDPLHGRLVAIIDQLAGRDDLMVALRRVRTLPSARYPLNQWAVAKSLFRVLSRALVELQIVFGGRNQCDFTELGLLARNALQGSGPEDLSAALGARLQHLLVDEMQDTSTSQYELIELLTASWDGHSQTVFLVGDPRQSIYLFRQARVERFIRAMNDRRIGELPLVRLCLTANFRSQRNLVTSFNSDFKLIFPDATADADPYALSYPLAQATLPSSTARGAVWHTHVLPPSTPDQTSAQTRQRQAIRNAAEILRIARHWFAKPLPPNRTSPWSIAVLVRSRNHLNELVTTLRKQRDPIPFRAVDIEALNERQEVLDLTALTRSLLHPADRVAALAVLRAPWCGLSLADLHALTGTDDPHFKDHSIQRLIAERGHLLPDEACSRMARVWTVLQSASSLRASLTTSQLVERAWRSLGGDAWLTPTQLTNTRRFFHLLDELESPGSRIDLTVLEDRLDRLYAEPEPVPAGSPFLELLTIHKAKGLEWDVVFLPALERSPGRNRPRLLTWSEINSLESPEDAAAHIMLAPIGAKGQSIDPLSRWLNGIHYAREAAERKRLFYVACTRAREELHLFAAPQFNVKGALNPVWDSLLKAAWPAAEPHFTQIAPAAAIDAPPATFAIAAAAVPPILQRLPPTFDPAARFLEARARRLPLGDFDSSSPSEAPFLRPEGSFAARSFGNVVHACLEMLSGRIGNGTAVPALLTELPTWTARIAGMLRSDGLPRAVVDQLARETRTTLETVLRDPSGAWLLAPHTRADSEFAVTAWPESRDGARPTSIRIDRVFHAGPEPHIAGEDFLWIVDYKTATHSTPGLDEFLNNQQATYGPQLEAYARILAPARSMAPEQVRLALYFPAIPRLLWWKATDTALAISK